MVCDDEILVSCVKVVFFPLRYNEVYTWNNVNSCVHNIIVGQLWIEQVSDIGVGEEWWWQTRILGDGRVRIRERKKQELGV